MDLYEHIGDTHRTSEQSNDYASSQLMCILILPSPLLSESRAENGTDMLAVALGHTLSRFIRGLVSFVRGPLIRIDKAYLRGCPAC